MVSAVRTELGRISDWLLFENCDVGRYSRDNIDITVPANTTYLSGVVLGKNAAGTLYVEYDNVDPDGGAAAGILAEPVSNTTGGSLTIKGVAVVRHARIAPKGLIYKTGLVDADKIAALADLKALGILTVAEA